MDLNRPIKTNGTESYHLPIIYRGDQIFHPTADCVSFKIGLTLRRGEKSFL